MIYLMGLGLARARRAGMRGTSVTDAERRTAMTAMFVMLAAMTAWAQTRYDVPYIDADGNAQTAAEATLVTTDMQGSNNGMFASEVEGNWLYVETSVTLVNASNTGSGGEPINLILGDGATLTINGTLRFPYGKSLNIYCQSGGTGRLVISGNRSGGGVLHVISSSTLTINGGIVEATNTNSDGYGFNSGTLVMNGGTATFTGGSYGYGIYANVTFNGGQLTATGGWGGIYRNTTISWKYAGDRIKASNYGDNVTIADGKYMKDASGHVYGGTLTDAQKSAIANVELQPASEAEFIAYALPQTVADTYTISDAAGWTAFCLALQDNTTYDRFSGKTVKLANDITVTRMAGSANHDFKGEFDGGGKTLTVSYGSAGSPLTEQYAAPFRYVESGANIHSLAVEGDIYTSEKYAGGIVGLQCGAVSISDCRSSVAIHSSVSGDGTHGGLVGLNNNTTGSELTIEGCLFNGKLLTTSTTDRCSGFVGWRGGTVSISNSLYDPATAGQDETWVGTSESATFVRNDGEKTTISNCFYTATLGTAQGKAPREITADDKVLVDHFDFTGDGFTYDVSGIDAHDGGGIDYGGTTYIGGGDVVQLSLCHDNPAEGEMFSHYTVTGGGTLDDETSNTPLLTMTDADQTIGAEYAPIPTHSATFATGSGGEGWTIDDDADGATPYEGKTVTVGYSGPHKVKSVTVREVPLNTLSGLKALIDAADETALAELKAEYVGKYITATGDIMTGSEGAVAVICYVGTDAETNADYKHGLALALADANGGSDCRWGQWASKYLTKQYSHTTEAKTDMAGIANTDELAPIFAYDDADAAHAARAYNSGAHPTGTSEWFLPSAGQWDKMATAAGGYADLKTLAGLPQSSYWSSTERDAQNTWSYNFSFGTLSIGGKTGYCYVRPVLAF